MDPLSTGKKIRFLTATVEDPQGYGRVIRKGKKIRIVEERDLTPKQREIRRVNGGVYYGPKELFEKGVKTLTTNNAQGEKYLVDILSLYPAEEREVSDPEEILGINTRYDYMRGIKILNRRILKKWMDEGVTILSPETTWVEGDVKLHRDVFLEPGVYLKGKTSVGEESKVGTGSILLDTVVGPRVEIRPYVVAEKATIEESSFIGPFSHLRPNTWIKKGSHIGNFVELKNTIFGPHSKANHLSYLGDAEVGAEVNVGAGTITCNYDGVQKHRTIIEDGVFIGSDTQLVAPVKVGKNAYIGAGTTVTRDVPPESLAISRVPQKEIPNYARRKKLSLKEKR
jgi:bifunctional UDP-N-acetylglucosamine pyrophosphorylase/glucosamine-1-phosphate N-acetyltransferase